MKAYLITVVWAAVAGTLAELIGVDEEGSGAKLLRLITGLMILSVVVAPLRSLLQIGPDALLDRLWGVCARAETTAVELGEQYARQTVDFIRAAGESGASAAVARLVAQQFALSEEDCRAAVELTEHEGQFSPLSVRIILSGKAILADPYAIESYLAALFSCPVSVALE